jgi:hypothetical protein
VSAPLRAGSRIDTKNSDLQKVRKDVKQQMVQSHHSLILRQEGSPLFQGDVVSLSSGSVSVKAVVVTTDGDQVVFAPVDNSDLVDRILGSRDLQVQWNGGASAIDIRTGTTITTVVAKLPVVEYLADERRHLRVDPEFKVEITTDGVLWTVVPGLNLSEGGLCGLSVRGCEPSRGQLVTLRIYLHGQSPITARGTVKRVNLHRDGGQDFAVQFTYISSEDRLQLAHFIENSQVEPQHREGPTGEENKAQPVEEEYTGTDLQS